ncbi:6871_t:CDS:10 [Paraglomus occultum]|uniref:Histone-lysine N-methyltransferase, H3 lysine-4 specific n=1 Tax=Paraglomus occultum TaxID=144539 RepID=A0A9N9AIU6_9GLOM|nr:6871_t:CDS:10 [Paraglomus occultum]
MSNVGSDHTTQSNNNNEIASSSQTMDYFPVLELPTTAPLSADIYRFREDEILEEQSQFSQDSQSHTSTQQQNTHKQHQKLQQTHKSPSIVRNFRCTYDPILDSSSTKSSKEPIYRYSGETLQNVLALILQSSLFKLQLFDHAPIIPTDPRLELNNFGSTPLRQVYLTALEPVDFIPDLRFGSPQPASVFVSNIPPITTDRQVASIFSNYGDDVRVKLEIHPVTGESLGLATVTYYGEDARAAARRAVKEGNGRKIGNERVKVEFDPEGVTLKAAYDAMIAPLAKYTSETQIGAATPSSANDDMEIGDAPTPPSLSPVPIQPPAAPPIERPTDPPPPLSLDTLRNKFANATQDNINNHSLHKRSGETYLSPNSTIGHTVLRQGTSPSRDSKLHGKSVLKETQQTNAISPSASTQNIKSSQRDLSEGKEEGEIDSSYDEERRSRSWYSSNGSSQSESGRTGSRDDERRRGRGRVRDKDRDKDRDRDRDQDNYKDGKDHKLRPRTDDDEKRPYITIPFSCLPYPKIRLEDVKGYFESYDPEEIYYTDKYWYIAFRMESHARRCMSALDDKLLFGYRLEMTFHEAKIPDQSISNHTTATNSSAPNQKSSINIETSLDEPLDIPALIYRSRKMVETELADVFLKDVKNRVVVPYIYDFLTPRLQQRRQAKMYKIKLVNEARSIGNNEASPGESKLIFKDGMVPTNNEKLPSFKKRTRTETELSSKTYIKEDNRNAMQRGRPRSIDFTSSSSSDNDQSHKHNRKTKYTTSSSSSEEGEIHSDSSLSSPTHLTVPSPPLPLATTRIQNKPEKRFHPQRLRDYLSTSSDDDDFLKDFRRRENERVVNGLEVADAEYESNKNNDIVDIIAIDELEDDQIDLKRKGRKAGKEDKDKARKIRNTRNIEFTSSSEDESGSDYPKRERKKVVRQQRPKQKSQSKQTKLKSSTQKMSTARSNRSSSSENEAIKAPPLSASFNSLSISHSRRLWIPTTSPRSHSSSPTKPHPMDEVTPDISSSSSTSDIDIISSSQISKSQTEPHESAEEEESDWEVTLDEDFDVEAEQLPDLEEDEVVDEEDLYYLKMALELEKAGRVDGKGLLEGVATVFDGGNSVTTFVDYITTKTPSPPPSPHATGCARTEGRYIIPLSQKMRYVSHVANRTNVSTPNIAVPSSTNTTTRITSRTNRAKNRLILADMAQYRTPGTADTNDIVKFNQLKGRKKQLRFAKSQIHDWGLFAMEHIDASDMVIEYVGEVVRQSVADHRERRYEQEGVGGSYLFRIDDDTVIDATKKGNIARFINHSCSE